MILEHHIFAHLFESLFNAANAYFDAYRITRHKKIAHGINFGAYAVLTAFLTWRYSMDVPEGVLYCISSFFNRQITFDPLLNLRRKLSAFYQSTAVPPKSVMDQIEQRLFGHISGKNLYMIYAGLFIVFLTAQLSA